MGFTTGDYKILFLMYTNGPHIIHLAYSASVSNKLIRTVLLLITIIE